MKNNIRKINQLLKAALHSVRSFYFSMLIRWTMFDFMDTLTTGCAYFLAAPWLIARWYKRKRQRLSFRIKQRQITAAIVMVLFNSWNIGSMFYKFQATKAEQWEYYLAAFGTLAITGFCMFVYGITYGKMKILESKHRAVGDLYGYGGNAREKIVIIYELQKQHMN